MVVVETIRADSQGSPGEGRSDQEDRPGFEGFEEHGAQGGSGRRDLVQLRAQDPADAEAWAVGEARGHAYNGHFGCTSDHPLFVFNQFGDLERCALRPGNVHSAHGCVMSWYRWSNVTRNEPSASTSAAMRPSLHRRSTTTSKPKACSTPSGCPPTWCCKRASLIS